MTDAGKLEELQPHSAHSFGALDGHPSRIHQSLRPPLSYFPQNQPPEAAPARRYWYRQIQPRIHGFLIDPSDD